MQLQPWCWRHLAKASWTHVNVAKRLYLCFLCPLYPAYIHGSMSHCLSLLHKNVKTTMPVNHIQMCMAVQVGKARCLSIPDKGSIFSQIYLEFSLILFSGCSQKATVEPFLEQLKMDSSRKQCSKPSTPGAEPEVAVQMAVQMMAATFHAQEWSWTVLLTICTAREKYPPKNHLKGGGGVWPGV